MHKKITYLTFLVIFSEEEVVVGEKHTPPKIEKTHGSVTLLICIRSLSFRYQMKEHRISFHLVPESHFKVNIIIIFFKTNFLT